MTLQAPQEPLFPGDIYILCVMAENGQNASKKIIINQDFQRKKQRIESLHFFFWKDFGFIPSPKKKLRELLIIVFFFLTTLTSRS